MGLLQTTPRIEPSDVAEHIDDPRRIACIFRALIRSNAVGRVVASGSRVTLLARERTTEAGGGAAGRRSLHWTCDGPALPEKSAIEIGGPLSLYRFSLEGAAATTGPFTTPIPAVVLRMRSRRELRMDAPEGVLLRLSKGESETPRVLCDVSGSGLSFATDAGDPFGRVGAIGDVVIEWQGRLRICASVQVRHVSEHADGARRIAGARLTFASPEDAYHWTAEVDALADPTTRTGGTWTRDIWALFESSGYFTLSHKSPDDFARRREAFAAASRKLGRAPELGTQIVWPSARGVEASSSVIALNRSAVFLYHLARRSGAAPSGLTGRALVYAVHARALWWIRARKDIRWLVVWVQDVARFSKRAHLDFIERNDDGQSACVVTVRAVEVAVHPLVSEARRIAGAPAEDAGDNAWTTRDARASDGAAIALAARVRFPFCFVAAHGLDAPLDRSFDLWDDAALRRGREIIVAERSGRIEAAAVLEWTEDGVHLFGLLDVFRLIPMGSAAGEAMPALVAHARHRFAHLGKSMFVLTCDPDLPAAQWPEGSSDLGLTHCTVMSTELIADLAEHAWEVITGAPR